MFRKGDPFVPSCDVEQAVARLVAKAVCLAWWLTYILPLEAQRLRASANGRPIHGDFLGGLNVAYVAEFIDKLGFNSGQAGNHQLFNWYTLRYWLNQPICVNFHASICSVFDCYNTKLWLIVPKMVKILLNIRQYFTAERCSLGFVGGWEYTKQNSWILKNLWHN